jgi:hypothetical protein
MTTMTDAQLVKVFSLKFTCELIASLHRDVRRKTLAPQDLSADVGKLSAFADHVTSAFENLSAGEQYSCDLAIRRVVDILRYAGHADEAARIETAQGHPSARAA